MIYRLITVSILALLLGSCNNTNSEPTVEDQNQRALTLIEKNQVDEAIEILKQEDHKFPNERTKVILASAYAKKANLEIKDYWGFTAGYKEFVTDSQEVGSKQLESFFGPQLAPAVLKELQKQGMSAADLQKLLNRLDQVPDKTFAEVDLLVQARSVLASTQSGGARLYRGILGIVILKFSIKKIIEYIPKAALASKDKCQASWETVSKWFDFSLVSIDEVLKDIVISYPQQRTEVDKATVQVQTFIKELPQKKKELTDHLCRSK